MIHILMQLIIATLPKTWLCSQRWRGGWWSGEQWMVICAHSLVGRMERDWWWQSKVETSCSTLLIILSPYQDPGWRRRFCRWWWWWWCGRGRRQAAAPPRNCALLIFPPLPSFTYSTNRPTGFTFVPKEKLDDSRFMEMSCCLFWVQAPKLLPAVNDRALEASIGDGNCH